MIKYFTSEHCAPGHPDKVMDTIAEAIVEYVVTYGKLTDRVAIDGCVKNNVVTLVGEVTADLDIPYVSIVKEVIRRIGYTNDVSPEFNDSNVIVNTLITKQSSDIAQGVDHDSKKESAGDIGIMFGGAIDEAPDYTGWAHYIARYLSMRMFKSDMPWMRPDQKTQVTIKYVDGVAKSISHIVVCVAHDAKETYVPEQLKQLVIEYLGDLKKFLNADGFELPEYSEVQIQCNPTGAFTIFGPIADAGEVGRKIVCDQYAGYFPVGGGNLNGKDSTKVDRSAVYMARYVAKQVVAKGYAGKCCIQVSYAIGQLNPISINVETYGTEKVPIESIMSFVNSFSFIPGDIIKRFKLNSPDKEFDYRSLGLGGHIGESFYGSKKPWEVIE